MSNMVETKDKLVDLEVMSLVKNYLQDKYKIKLAMNYDDGLLIIQNGQASSDSLLIFDDPSYGKWSVSALSAPKGTKINYSGNTITLNDASATLVPFSKTDKYTYTVIQPSHPTTLNGNIVNDWTVERTENTYAINFIDPAYGHWTQSSITAPYSTPVSVNKTTITVGTYGSSTLVPDEATTTYEYTAVMPQIRPTVGTGNDYKGSVTASAIYYTVTLQSATFSVSGHDGGHWEDRNGKTFTRIAIPGGTPVRVSANHITFGQLYDLYYITPSETANYYYRLLEITGIKTNDTIIANTEVSPSVAYWAKYKLSLNAALHTSLTATRSSCRANPNAPTTLTNGSTIYSQDIISIMNPAQTTITPTSFPSYYCIQTAVNGIGTNLPVSGNISAYTRSEQLAALKLVELSGYIDFTLTNCSNSDPITVTIEDVCYVIGTGTPQHHRPSGSEGIVTINPGEFIYWNTVVPSSNGAILSVTWKATK